MRAAVSNFVSGRRGQGGSTITMQVARNFFLSSERSYIRKIYEIALAYKIESSLVEGQDLRGLCQPDLPRSAGLRFLGRLAGLLRQEGEGSDGRGNGHACGPAGGAERVQPFVNPKRAKSAAAVRAVADAATRIHRQGRRSMRALAQELKPRHGSALRESEAPRLRLHAEYAAELARQLVLRGVRQRDLYARPERHDDAAQGGSGSGLRRPAQGGARLRPQVRLSRTGSLHRTGRRRRTFASSASRTRWSRRSKARTCCRRSCSRPRQGSVRVAVQGAADRSKSRATA